MIDPLRIFRPQPPADDSQHALRCLVVGAGEAGRAIAQDLRSTPNSGLDPVGYLDDSPPPQVLGDMPVLGGLADLPDVTRAHAIDLVIIAIPSLPPAHIRGLARTAAASADVSVRYLPPFIADLDRGPQISDLRRLDVDRLLGRTEVNLLREMSGAVVRGRRVLVTGAGGSIGSELCRQISRFDPSALYLLDHDETNLHTLQLALHGQALLDDDEVIIADIRDADRIRQLFADLRPEVVFHAAAHKHLPLLERHPCEGVKSNVIGTRNLVESAVAAGVDRFILVSTDKAADPTSILGATKRLAEMIVQMYAGSRTKFASVRFGNVLGSRGSFLAVLTEQIEKGEPVTVTHPDVTRFFMTVEEAVGLVLEAAGMASSGETFVLDMGEPIRIRDLVRNFAHQVLPKGQEVTITYTGLRPGEKLDERLFGEAEDPTATAHPKIWSVDPSGLPGDFLVRLQALIAAASANRSADIRRHLSALIPEYQPVEPVADATLMSAPYPDGF